ncbi:hypothetical protein HNR19_000281 [Nocardioides thalensis]|uniref:Uncharacterized protein n=1 Tax=Nocardioides thalensis TaxID=1914755 RepID=A0A853BZM3_9ACTN|nr:hypothetical protein [Nocardioides thalensis]NYI99582.1 hypothetical protein [Nocardioides thalensis]
MVAVLDQMPAVDVLSLRAEPATFEVGGSRLPMVEVAIQASAWEDAILLATALGLREIDGHYADGLYGRSVWRTWVGWVPEASRVEPVQVKVTASELEHELPTLFDALEAFGKDRGAAEGVA